MAKFQPIGAVAVNVLAKCDAPIFRDYSSVVRIVAHRLARRVIERQLPAQGVGRVALSADGRREQDRHAFVPGHD